MANAFFNDTLPPFEGIDMGWGQDPNFPIGEYAVVQDAAGAEAANKQFTLSQTEDDEIALSEGVLMITGPATSGLTPAREGGLDFFPPEFEVNEESGFAGRAAWHQIGDRFAAPEEGKPLLAKGLEGVAALTVETTGPWWEGGGYGFWLTFQSDSTNTQKARPHSAVGRLVIEEIAATVRFIGSRDYNSSADAFKLVAKLGQEDQAAHSVIFLGSATVEMNEGKKVATFTQYTFGPLTLPTISYLDDLVSEDQTSRLTVGDDKSIKTSSIAAGDSTTNDIYENADGQVQLRIGVVTDGNIVIVRDEVEGQPTIPKIGVEGVAEDDHTH